MNDYLLYVCVGVLIMLTLASIVAIAWLCDDRKARRELDEREQRSAWLAHEWYKDPFEGRGHPHIRANRDRDSV